MRHFSLFLFLIYLENWFKSREKSFGKNCMQLCWLNQIYIDLFVRGKEKQASISYSVLLGLVLCYFLLIHSLHQSSPPFCLTIGSTCFLSSWPEGQPQFLRGHTQWNRGKGHFGYHWKEELCTSMIRTLTTLYDRCQSKVCFWIISHR